MQGLKNGPGLIGADMAGIWRHPGSGNATLKSLNKVKITVIADIRTAIMLALTKSVSGLLHLSFISIGNWTKATAHTETMNKSFLQ